MYVALFAVDGSKYVRPAGGKKAEIQPKSVPFPLLSALLIYAIEIAEDTSCSHNYVIVYAMAFTLQLLYFLF